MPEFKADAAGVADGRADGPGGRARAATSLCAAVLAGVGLMGLAGGLTGARLLDSPVRALVPMALSTATFFLLFALLLRTQAGAPRPGRRTCGLLAGCMGLLGLLNIAGALLGRSTGLPDLAFRQLSAWLGTPPVDMSPATSCLFVLASASGLCLTEGQTEGLAGRPTRGLARAAGPLAALVLLSGSVFLLGYVFGTPLLYGTGVVPMARSTALAFVVLGMGLVCAAGPQLPPLSLFAGDSTKAVLLRAFVPLVVALSLAHSLVMDTGNPRFGEGNALLVAGIAVGAAVLVGLAVLLAARRVGGALERAELRRDEAEREVRAALQEKTILLKELHHRVKNNIQIVSSLLMLQAEHVADPRDRELFEASRKRLGSMAMVHESLYASTDLSLVDMRGYVRRLVEQLLGGSDPPVRLTLELEDVRLPLVQCVPCGLLLNELVMNAMKHAFTGAATPTLRVLLRTEGGMLELAVEDNGPGLPEGFTLGGHASLGMLLVESLTRQLHGEAAAGNVPGGGARFSLRFPRAGE
jgi:Signal transduction histidine kinase